MQRQIPEKIIATIKEQNDIVDIVSEYVALKQRGNNYFGLCPFHEENTPSFSVSSDKQIFHCFGCKKGGNIFSFLMEIENFSFVEAVQLLAEKSNIALPSIKRQSSMPIEDQQMLDAYEWVTKLYHHLLKYTKDGKDGYDYLKERGIHEETIDQFQIGYVPLTDDLTSTFLAKKGFHQQLLIKAGLLKQREDGTITEPFRARIIFPIRNHLGKTVAFSGRALGDGSPKYLNSPETSLFKKSHLFYNFDQAKRHMRKQREVVLFEGQMDVISAHQAGIKHCIATLGTSLTEFQAKLLKRYVETVIICYDGDFAGQEASYRSAQLLRRVGCQIKIARLPKGMDPDQFIQTEGADVFQNMLHASDTYMAFYMDYLKKDYNLRVEGDRIAYIQSILRELATIESSVEREYYLKPLSEEFHLSYETLQNDLNTILKERSNHQDSAPFMRHTNQRKQQNFQSHEVTLKERLLPAEINAERKLLAYMLQDPSIAIRVQKEIGSSFNLDEHSVIATHLYAYYETHDEPDLSMFLDFLTDDALKQLVTELAMTTTHGVTDQAIDDYIQYIKRSQIHQDKLASLMEEQRRAEQQNDPIKAAEIAMKMINLQKQLK